MAYEIRDLSGSIFKNDKRKTDAHPHAQGSCRIDGVDYWISAWTKRTKDGDPWQSLAFKRKDEQPQSRSSRLPPAGSVDDPDDLPF